MHASDVIDYEKMRDVFIPETGTTEFDRDLDRPFSQVDDTRQIMHAHTVPHKRGRFYSSIAWPFFSLFFLYFFATKEPGHSQYIQA